MADLVGSELLVGDERGFDGASAVGFGGPGVGACGVGCGVPHEVDDDDNVDAVAQELVPNVRRRVWAWTRDLPTSG